MEVTTETAGDSKVKKERRTLNFSDARVRALRLPMNGYPAVPYWDSHAKTAKGRHLMVKPTHRGGRPFYCVWYEPQVSGVTGKSRMQPVFRKIGDADTMSVAEARRIARTFKPEELAKPKKAKLEAEAAAGPMTFGQAAEKWMTSHVAASKLRTEPEMRRILDIYVLPRWSRLPVPDIRRSTVSALLDGIAEGNGPSMADSVKRVITGVLKLYRGKYDDTNTYVLPITAGHRSDKRSKDDRLRKHYLSAGELKALWAATAEPTVLHAMVRFLALTGQRIDRVIRMRRDEVVDGVWHMPKLDRAKGTGGVLRLPQMALDVLASVPAMTGNPYQFPGRGGAFYTGHARSKPQLDARMNELLDGKLRPWVYHDLRRTLKIHAEDALGVAPHVTEALLGHILKTTAVESSYAGEQAKRLARQKAEALQLHADFVQRLVDPPPVDNVLAFPVPA